MKRRTFLKAAGLAPLIAQCGGKSKAKAMTDKPNVLLITIDDGGFGSLSPYNSAVTWTPNIQRLADEGTVYKRFYTPAPVCGPSRFCLQSGAYPIDHGVIGNQDAIISLPTIGSRMQLAGYRTGIAGKWHLGGTDYDYAIDPQYHPAQWGYDWSWLWGQWPGMVDFNDYLFSTHKTFVAASDFIRSTDPAMPFYLNINFPAPHYPHYPATPPGTLDYFETQVAEIDWAVGALIEQLSLRGQLDDTIIMFLVDNGSNQDKFIHTSTGETWGLGWGGGPPDCMNPDRWLTGDGFGNDFGWTFRPPSYEPTNTPDKSKISQRTGKGSVYEGGVRIPLIVRWGNAAVTSAQDSGLHFLADIFATLDLLVNGVNTSTVGKDLLTDSHTTLHVRFGHGANLVEAVVQEDWKYFTHSGELHYVGNGGAFNEMIDYAASYPQVASVLANLAHGNVLPPQGWPAP